MILAVAGMLNSKSTNQQSDNRYDYHSLEHGHNPALKSVFAKSLADCEFLLVKTQFCRTVLYGIIVILEIFAGHLSDRIKYFVNQNEILLVLSDRPALFVKTALIAKYNVCSTSYNADEKSKICKYPCGLLFHYLSLMKQSTCRCKAQ